MGSGVAHVLNRGNRRERVFESAGEYEQFIALLDEARRRHEVDVFAFCIMPNHFHLVARFEEPQKLSAMMRWWLTTHVRRHHERRGTTGEGHIWQDRFKSFPIQEDVHLLTVLRYVLLNPLRARLVDSPWAWRWSSLWFRSPLTAWPVNPPKSFDDWLNDPVDRDDDESVRVSIRRGSPFGDEEWKDAAARAWGLESTLRPIGRPRQLPASNEPEQFVLI
jgi:putative transposase